MKVLCQCPSCGVEMSIDKSLKRPVIKCPKCAHTAPLAEFREVPTRTIYCPECNAPFTIRQDKPPKTIKCSKCGLTNLTAKFTDVPQAVIKEAPDDIPTDTSLGDDSGRMYRPAKLRMQKDEGGWKGTVRDFTLVRGRNVLGRQSPNSSADIRFPTTDTYMSKNHAVIDVVMKPKDSTFEHLLSDNRSTNGTFHNGNRLEQGDEIILSPGDTLRMGRTTFLFIPE
ncbi:FHA domain-containing protein [Bacteroides sp. UBA939]|uniref:FHA domain-containing protein n=1 Tax=Bacteroides sp. UBA939 TaxID=1946092 RepID=UPI0025C58503|nr:FHA domain-containing protein [Bacteroides sp. UBA939]